MSPEAANRVYDLLVEKADASEFWRGSFVAYVTGPPPPGGSREFRFGRLLGSGGKFWPDRDPPRVTCYLEDETPARLRIMNEINEWLKTAELT